MKNHPLMYHAEAEHCQKKGPETISIYLCKFLAIERNIIWLFTDQNLSFEFEYHFLDFFCKSFKIVNLLLSCHAFKEHANTWKKMPHLQ